MGRLSYECDGDARQQIRIRLLRDQSRYGLAKSQEDYTKKDNKLSAMVILIVIKKLASNDALLQFV